MERGSRVVGVLAYSLAGVFGLSALTKATSLERTRSKLVQYGIPDQHAEVATNCLICGEAAIGVSLTIPQTRREGGVLGAASLVVFSVSMINHLMHGRAPECGCFGATSDQKVSWKLVGRNGMLMAGMMVVVSGGKGLRAPRSMPALISLGRKHGLHLAIGVEGLVLARLLYQFGAIARGLEGAQASILSIKKGDIVRSEGNGVVAEIVNRAAGGAALFVHSQCKHCEALMPILRKRLDSTDSKLVLVYQGTERELELAGLGDSFHDVIFDSNGTATSQIGVQFTPTLLQIDEEGRLSDDMVHGTDDVIGRLERWK